MTCLTIVFSAPAGGVSEDIREIGSSVDPITGDLIEYSTGPDAPSGIVPPKGPVKP